MAEINDSLRIVSRAELNAALENVSPEITVNGKQPDENGILELGPVDIAARPNANLLHNWYFGNPVNRNGKTEFYNGYGIDRWYNPQVVGRHITVGDSGLQATVPYAKCLQNIENFKDLIGKTVTLSMLYKSNATGNYQRFEIHVDGSMSSNYSMDVSADFTLDTQTFVVPEATSSIAVGFATSSNFDGTLFEVKAIKLELGDTQTLAHQENGNWVLNEIPDFAEQMAICMQYDKTTGAYTGITASDVGAMYNNYGVQSGIDILAWSTERIAGGWFLADMDCTNLPEKAWFSCLLLGAGSNKTLYVINSGTGEMFTNTTNTGNWGSWKNISGDFKADGSVAMTQPLKFFADKGFVGTEYADDITLTYMRSLFGDESHLLDVSNYGVRYIQGTKDNKWGSIYNIYGEHNITKGTASLEAGTSALGKGCIYLQYE